MKTFLFLEIFLPRPQTFKSSEEKKKITISLLKIITWKLPKIKVRKTRILRQLSSKT